MRFPAGFFCDELIVGLIVAALRHFFCVALSCDYLGNIVAEFQINFAV